MGRSLRPESGPNRGSYNGFRIESVGDFAKNVIFGVKLIPKM